MKNLFWILIFFCAFGYSQTQTTGTDVIAFQGNVTTTIRDAYDVPTGEFWLIYNTTTDQLEIAGDDDVWSAFTAGGSDNLGSDLDRGDIVISGSGTIATIDTDAVTSAKILDATITADDLANNSVTTSQILNGTVTGADIFDSGINEVDLNITNAATEGYVLTSGAGNTLEWGAAGGSGLASTDIDTFSELDAIVADEDLVKATDLDLYLLLSGGQLSGNITFSANNKNIGSTTTPLGFLYSRANYYEPVSPATKSWKVTSNNSGDDLYFEAEDSAGSDTHSVQYSMNDSGSPTAATDLTDKNYVDAADAVNGSGISTLGADVATLSAVPASQFGFNEQSSPYTLVANDALDSVIVKVNYNNEALTIPSGVFSEGNAIRIIKDTGGTNETRIIEGSGVSLTGFTDGFTLGTYPSGVTVARTSAATSPEVWEVIDYFGSIADYTSASLGSELLTNGDDFSSGWTYQNGSSAGSGVATAIGNGTLISSASNHVVYQNITALTDTSNYRITITWRRTSGTGDAYVGIKFLHQQTVAGLSASFVEQTFDFTAGASGEDRIAIGAASGTTLEIDSISLKEIL